MPSVPNNCLGIVKSTESDFRAAIGCVQTYQWHSGRRRQIRPQNDCGVQKKCSTGKSKGRAGGCSWGRNVQQHRGRKRLRRVLPWNEVVASRRQRESALWSSELERTWNAVTAM